MKSSRPSAWRAITVAVNSNGDAGVIFAGFGGFSQDDCVAPAESDLNSLSE